MHHHAATGVHGIRGIHGRGEAPGHSCGAFFPRNRSRRRPRQRRIVPLPPSQGRRSAMLWRAGGSVRRPLSQTEPSGPFHLFCGFRAILPRPVRGAAPKSTPVGHCEAATKKWSGRMTPYGPGGGGSSAALQFGVDPIGSNFSLRLASEPPALRLNRQKQVEWTTSPTIANLPNGVTFAIH